MRNMEEFRDEVVLSIAPEVVRAVLNEDMDKRGRNGGDALWIANYCYDIANGFLHRRAHGQYVMPPKPEPEPEPEMEDTHEAEEESGAVAEEAGDVRQDGGGHECDRAGIGDETRVRQEGLVAWLMTFFS